MCYFYSVPTYLPITEFKCKRWSSKIKAGGTGQDTRDMFVAFIWHYTHRKIRIEQENKQRRNTQMQPVAFPSSSVSKKGGKKHKRGKRWKKRKQETRKRSRKIGNRNSHGIILVQQVAETHPRITLWCLNLQWLRANFFRRHDPRLR